MMLLDRLKLDVLNKDDVDDRINVDIDGFPTLFGRINEVKDEDERFATFPLPHAPKPKFYSSRSDLPTSMCSNPSTPVVSKKVDLKLFAEVKQEGIGDEVCPVATPIRTSPRDFREWSSVKASPPCKTELMSPNPQRPFKFQFDRTPPKHDDSSNMEKYIRDQAAACTPLPSGRGAQGKLLKHAPNGGKIPEKGMVGGKSGNILKQGMVGGKGGNIPKQGMGSKGGKISKQGMGNKIPKQGMVDSKIRKQGMVGSKVRAMSCVTKHSKVGQLPDGKSVGCKKCRESMHGCIVCRTQAGLVLVALVDGSFVWENID